MTKIRKKHIAFLLSLVLLFNMVHADGFLVKAESDSSNYFTFSSYQKDNEDEKNNYDTVLSTTGLYETEIDGVAYTNYALKSTGKASAKCGSDSCNGIIDGNAKSGFQAKKSLDIQSMTIDLGRTRSISRLQLSWETASAQTYGIDFSLDGEDWTTVAYVDNCTKKGARCDVIVLNTPQNTHYVRFQGLKRQTTWAYNLWELSAFSASGKADGSNPIAAYTYTEEQKAAIKQADDDAKAEEEAEREYEEYIKTVAGYIDTDTNLAKGTAAYTTGYFGGEGKLTYLTDGKLDTKATTDTINSSNTQQYFVLDLGKEYIASDIDKIYCQFGSNTEVWGKDGFKLYAANNISITTKKNDQDYDVIDEDDTEWNLLFVEDGTNSQNQNYYEPFNSDYTDSFRYVKIEFNRITKNNPYGIQLNEFALYAPVEENPEPDPGPGGDNPIDVPLPSVTEKSFVNENSKITNVTYDFKFETAGYAAGTISIEASEDATYSIYWGLGDETEGYGAIQKKNVPYTALTSVTTVNGAANFTTTNDYLAIPEGATKVLIFNDKNELQFVYDIPEYKQLKNNAYKYTFASVSDVHYNRYSASGTDDALFAFDNALKFLRTNDITFVGVCGDLSSRSEEDAYIKFKEATGDYPELTIFSVKGNHDGEGNADQYFRKYVNRDIYDNIGKSQDELDAMGILAISDNGEDFVYSPMQADGDVFIFLNQSIKKTDMTTTMGILQEEQLDWLEEQIDQYRNQNIFLYFHTYLSTDDHSTSKCVGNLKSTGGYSYNLTYDVNASDGERLRSIINKYDNVTMFNGHSHFTYDMQMYNPYVNIGTSNGTPFHSGATLIHVSSVTEPRVACADKNDRIQLNNQASEGTKIDVYDGYRVYTGIDFWNGQYEAYATYIDGDLPPVETVPVSVKGDVNLDNQINTKDVLLILKKASGELSEEEDARYNWENGDINGDDKITSVDALLVLKMFLTQNS